VAPASGLDPEGERPNPPFRSSVPPPVDKAPLAAAPAGKNTACGR